MAMSKIERIEKEIQKTREKITEYQNRLRGRIIFCFPITCGKEKCIYYFIII